MEFIADFHIHSHYSRSTSPQMNVAGITKWGKIKGIQLIGTGDFTHPQWFLELQEKLEPAEPGLFKLKDKYFDQISPEIPSSCQSEMRFMLTAEISTIYSKNGKCRKIHSILCAPSFEDVAKINDKLSQIGNLKSDGRPILGLDCKELMQITLDVSSENMFILAHAWTPHFSVFGSGSGFDTLEECLEELTPQLTAIETGLSSDPAMNRLWSDLDNITLISNSDAHSPMKLGREANRLNTELDYYQIKKTLKNGNPENFKETIEFYPEEGKYHLDGHRKCGIFFHPDQTTEHQGICPKCERKLTVGVLNRVLNLADRPHRNIKKTLDSTPKTQIPYRSLVPLADILSSVLGTAANSKKVLTEYFTLINEIGNEFHILLDAPLADLEKIGGPQTAKAIEKMRQGDLEISPGYDGEYGKVNVFSKDTNPINENQQTIF